MDRRLQLGLGGIGVGVAVSTRSYPKLTFQLAPRVATFGALDVPWQVGFGSPKGLGRHGKWH